MSCHPILSTRGLAPATEATYVLALFGSLFVIVDQKFPCIGPIIGAVLAPPFPAAPTCISPASGRAGTSQGA
jgi:hypothetical protein